MKGELSAAQDEIRAEKSRLRKVLSTVAARVHDTDSPINRVDLDSTVGAASFVNTCLSQANEEIEHLRSRLGESEREKKEWQGKFEESEKKFQVAARFNRMKTPMAVSKPIDNNS